MGELARLKVDSPGFLRSPRPGPGVCVDCFNLTRGFRRCFACSHMTPHLAAMLPISYSVGHEYLHHVLASYKRLQGPRAMAAAEQIAVILERFLNGHEACLAEAVGVDRFDLVTTVPSSDPRRDDAHPLRHVVSDLVQPTRARHERLLRRTAEPVAPRHFHPHRFECVRAIAGSNVLLIDDTWTTGASAQSAAAALKAAGAHLVAAVVVGRHLNRDWYETDQHIDGLQFDWSRCALCANQNRMGKAA